MAFTDFLITAFQLLIGPSALAFLVWCYFKVQNDSKLAMPAKMSLDVLESEKAPEDWENLGIATTEEEDEDEEESDSDEEGGKAVAKVEKDEDGHGHSHDDDGHGHTHSHNEPKASAHTHSHNGVPCHGHGDPNKFEEGDLKIKLGVGPQGVKGRPNQGRPDPRTMKLMLLESLKDKKQKLEEKKESMDQELYKKQMENLLRTEENAKKMPTDKAAIEKNMEQKALKNARQTAKNQLEAIAKARSDILRARAENRVPDHIFAMNINRMKAGEEQFNKMLECDDEELLEMMKMMQQKAMQMQRMQQVAMAKKKAEMERQKAEALKASQTPRITEIEEEGAEEINMDDHEKSDKSPTRLRRNVVKK